MQPNATPIQIQLEITGDMTIAEIKALLWSHDDMPPFHNAPDECSIKFSRNEDNESLIELYDETQIL